MLKFLDTNPDDENDSNKDPPTPEQVTSDYIDIDAPSEDQMPKVSLNPLPPERLIRRSEDREKSTDLSAKGEGDDDDDDEDVSAGSCGDVEDNLDDTASKMDGNVEVSKINVANSDSDSTITLQFNKSKLPSFVSGMMKNHYLG